MSNKLTGFDVTLRSLLTPVAIVAAISLAAVALSQAASGEMLGSLGSLLVMVVVGAIGLKFAAEVYLFSYLGGDPSPREQIAQRMIGEYAGLTKLRFLLGSLGGVILPLGVQILSAGLKDVRPVSDPTIPAVLACFAVALLVPAEYAERRLWRLTSQQEANSN